MRLFFLFLIFLNTVPSGWAQTEDSAASVAENRSEALASLLVAVESLEGEVDALRNELNLATTDADRKRLEEDLTKQSSELEELQRRFRESAAGIDLTLFEETEKEPFSWEQTIGKILEPILEEVEKATASSRKRSDLQIEKDQFGKRAEAAAEALARIEETLSTVEEPAMRQALEAERELWEDRLLLTENRAQAATLQLEELDAQSEGFVGETTSFIRGFLADRGLNLVVGILAAVIVFSGLRLLLAIIQKLRTGDRPDSLGNRIFLLMTNLFSIVGAITALLIAFSAAGDLFLLGIVLVFLIGAAWAGIQVIPQFIESLKIILNIGMVREDQRILFDGVPWNVESLSFTCVLVNDALDDARQVLPVRRLVGLHSRPWCADEAAFPCRRGEWIDLSDGTIGESISQNPGTVTLREWGGAEKTYTTTDFLAQSPRNLTHHGFRVTSRFGIDYAHQAICTDSVLEWFEEALKERLPGVVEVGHIGQIRVLFASAGASSLDYEVQVDLKGAAADMYRDIEYAIQRILVEACNAHDLTIPFQQLTVHQAG